MQDKPILVSACLLGTPCRYDGTGKPDERILALAKTRTLIPVCPEQLGGLATPRQPAERLGARVVTRTGEDVTEAFIRGAKESLRLYRLFDCRAAVLKARSPSCGCGQIHDGSFSGALVEGNGITVDLLQENGVTVYTEADDLDAVL